MQVCNILSSLGYSYLYAKRIDKNFVLPTPFGQFGRGLHTSVFATQSLKGFLYIKTTYLYCMVWDPQLCYDGHIIATKKAKASH